MPYDAIFDNSTYAWTGGMGNDHVSRLNTKTGEFVDYLLPSKTNIRRVDVDKSVKSLAIVDRQQSRRRPHQGRAAGTMSD